MWKMINYVDSGRGETIVFLHGWVASSRFWRFSIERFSREYRCIAPDLPGFGKSRGYRSDLENMALATEQLLKKMGIVTYHLVGHSMGGSVAVLLHERNRAAVRSIALVNSPLSWPEALYDYYFYLFRWPLRNIIYCLSRIAGLRRLITRDYDLIYRIDREMARDMLKATFRDLVSSFESFSRADLTAKMKAVSCPIMVVSSDQDNVIKTSAVKHIKELVPSCIYLEMKGVGHCSMIENPSEFNVELGRFLRLTLDTGSAGR
jgi:3-oxoadipate enol-lactonase